MKRLLFIVIGIVALAVVLIFVFSGKLILPQYFSIGELSIHYYGIIMALAVLAGYLFARIRSAQYGVNLKLADDLIFWVIVGGFVGARVYHILSSFEYYWQHPLETLKVWNGGLSIFGAVLGGLLVVLVLAKIEKLKALNLLDWLAPSLVLGQIIGRFGNLFNYEAFGYPTGLPWKMFVPESFRPESMGNFSHFHPLFLYEVLGNIIILVFLLSYQKNHQAGLPAKTSTDSDKFGQTNTKQGAQSSIQKAWAGELFFIYLLLYNILRFFLEFLRTDSTFVYGVRLNSVTSFVLILASLLALTVIKNHNFKNDQVP